MKLSFFYFLIRLLTFSGICSQKLSPKNKKNLMIFQTIKPGKKLFHKCIPCNEIPFVPIFAVVKFFFPNKRPVANHILKTLSKRKICLVFPYIENRRSVVTSSDEAIAKYFCHIIGKSRIFFRVSMWWKFLNFNSFSRVKWKLIMLCEWCVVDAKINWIIRKIDGAFFMNVNFQKKTRTWKVNLDFSPSWKNVQFICCKF